MMLFRLLLLFWNTITAGGFLIAVDSSSSVSYFHRSLPRDDDHSCLNEDVFITLPFDIACDVRLIAEQLFGNAESLESVMIIDDNNITAQDDETSGPIIFCHKDYQGEMSLPSSVPYSERFPYFMQAANNGDPRAQHSVGLLLWNGFASSSTEEDATTIDPAASARWHAAAAIQGNLDALAVFGGCLRTGTGVGKCKNIALGLKCIEFAASVGNPSGVNKKAALMEANDDYSTAMKFSTRTHQRE